MKNNKQLRETMHSNSRAVEENEQGGNVCICPSYKVKWFNAIPYCSCGKIDSTQANV
jgi:hypothetical protein